MIYQRHIFNTVLRSIFGAIGLITSFVWLGQVIKLLYLLGRGISILDFTYVTLLVLPYLFFILFPFAITVGAMMGYNKLYHDRELLILNSVGVAPYSMLQPLLKICIIFTVIAYFCSIYLVPVSYSKLKSTLNYMRDHFTTQIVQDKVFIPITKNTTMYANTKGEDGVLHGIVVFDNNNPPPVVLFAQSGTIISDQQHNQSIELHQGVRQELTNQGRLNSMCFTTMSVPLTQNACSNTDAKCAAAAERTKRTLQEYFINELFYPESHTHKARFIAEGVHRVVWPLYNIIAPLFALSIFVHKPYHRTKDNGKLLIKIMIYTIIIFVIHFTLYNTISRF